MQGPGHQGKRLLSFFRRHPFLDAALIFLLACRIALPLVLRSIVAARASDVINGRVEIGDLDLWLLRGAVALQDVAVFPERAGAPPIITWHNLYVRISWPDLFKRSLRLRRVRLESPRVHADRLKSGTLNLSHLITSGPAAVETPAAPAQSPGWTVAADAVVMTAGTVVFQDYTVGNPLRIEATLNRLQVQEVSLNHGTYEEPTRIELQAHVEGAPLHVTAHLTAAEKGVRLQAVVKGKDLPLRLVRLYIPSTRWSQLHGRLDGTVHYRMESGVRDELRGHVTVRDLIVRVPELDRPALRWGSLAVDVGRLDLLHHRATVKSINAVDAAVIVQPAGPVLVPLLGRAASAAEPPAGRGDSPSDGGKEESTGKRADQAHAAPPSARDDRHPWHWTVAHLGVRDSHVIVLGAQSPLDVVVGASGENLSTESATSSPISVELKVGKGTLAASGSLRVQPFGFGGSLRWTALSLAQLLRAVTPDLAALIRSGRTEGELEVVAGAETSGGAGLGDRAAASPGTLRANGYMTVADVSLAEDDPEQFSVQWKTLRADVAEIRIPEAVFSGSEEKALEPVAVRLQRLRLSQPACQLTRTAAGLILPAWFVQSPAASKESAASAGQQSRTSPASAGATDQAQPQTAAVAEAGAPARSNRARVRIDVARLDVSGGQLSVTDQSVTPFFRGRMSEMEVQATDIAWAGLGWPGLRVTHLSLRTAAFGGAPLSLSGAVAAGDARLTLEGKRIDLLQFNPYATTYSNYSVARGDASLTSTIHVASGRYDTANHVVLHDFSLQGTRGENIFRDQFGIPLSLALALMRDAQGNITLDLPLSGDAQGAQVGLLSTVRNSLQHVVLNAITSPLKLVGLVTLGGGKVEDFAVQPLLFQPGSAALAPRGQVQAQHVAALLARHPGLDVALAGQIGAVDVDWLKEADLLVDMGQGRADAAPADTQAQAAVRDYLEARVARQPAPPLPESAKPVLDALLNQRRISRDRLVRLATDRTRHVRKILEEQSGVSAKRIKLKTATGQVTRGAPAVLIDIAPG